ncbi:uncharacterized protein LOC112463685, partial [Temnothorax curvispinosus]|uniref:Uncharacterized protein LOC112463685 n=1 Tax=Temnothorax curvispinosus TaxID=300111 RepID=A0A6J1QZD2_9HYME
MPIDTETLIRSQTELHGRISRAYENLKKSGTTKVTLGVAEARLQGLESNWAKFEAQHESIFDTPWERIKELDYVKQSVFALAEEAYLHQKGIFLDLVRSLKAKEDAASSTAGQETATVTSRTALPRIQLPEFTGKYEDWPAFRDLFLSIVGKDTAATQVEKLHYLKSCLKGEAELLIRNVTTTGENYERAWNLLSSYYENKRLLVRAYLANFVSLPKMKSESAVELRKIFHGVKATVSSLDGIGRPVSRSEDLFVYLAVELLDPRSRREWETLISETNEPPTYFELEQFLDRRLHALESMLPVRVDSAANKSGNGTAKSARSHLASKQGGKSEGKRGRCPLCTKEHILMFCDEYKKKTAQERRQFVEEKSLCFNCLGRHKVSECVVKKNCSACDARHHSSIHDACRETEIAKTSHVVRGAPVKPVAVLLATARVRVADHFGAWHSARALVDQGSEISMISERLAQQLKLPRLPVSISVFGIGGQKTSTARGRVSLSMSPRSGGAAMAISAIILPRLSAYASGTSAVAMSWAHIRGLSLADPDYSASDAIDVLLGADVYAAILRQGLRRGGNGEPVAQNTTLGWIISGSVGELSSGHSAQAFQCRVEEDLADMVRRFWEQDEIPSTSSVILSQEDRECAEHFARTHRRNASGRYVVRLPVKSPLPDLSDTRRVAVRVLKHMEGRFARDASFHALYRDFMRQYAELGHMTPIPPNANGNDKPRCYLPHHGVMRESSTTTKLRVVFNGSTTVPSGESLNRHLMVGPNLLPPLIILIIKWRRHRFVFATDIEKMYRQIVVDPEDRDMQIIVWRNDPSEEIQDHWLNTITYGLTCSPYLAIQSLRQLAADEREKWPLGAAVLEDETYMDDVLSGAATIPAAKAIQRQLVQICTAGGFPLKKWSANDDALLEDLPVEDRLQQEPRGWQPGESHLTLGLRWHPRDDCFAFAIRLPRVETFSRRAALSLTARLFDPLGWLAPVTVRAKIMIQSTWLLGIDWDTPLPDDDSRRWHALQDELPLLEAIRIPRWLTCGPEGRRIEIHGFSDASERAYAAVIYVRTEDESGRVEVRMVAAKTKVAPLKQVTLPRLELSAAKLLVQLAAPVQLTLEAREAPLYCWTDAKVVLGWIRGHPANWKTYVANRVSEIQTSLPNAQWHHVSGRDNPADCASRGLSPQELLDHQLWWQGPPWLRTEAGPWGTSSSMTELQDDLPERRALAHAAATSAKAIDESPLLTAHSSLLRLLRVTAWCRRWLARTGRVRIREASIPLTLGAGDLEEARRCWLRVVQATHFQEELATIRRGEPLPSRSCLAKLSPFQDEHGLLRVGGRLRNSLLALDAKHPVILPSGSHFTGLVIDAHHRRTLHGGVQMTLGSLRQEYWLPKGRALVKNRIHRCVTCLRWRAASPQPIMGDLPPSRVIPARPFLNTGVDYAGPVWLRTTRGRGHSACKAFITVF